MRDFNDKSNDAMFARVLARLDEQDRAAGKTNAEFLVILQDIRTEAKKTNGRVTNLETWRAVVKGKLALIATGISAAVALVAWLIDHWPST